MMEVTTTERGHRAVRDKVTRPTLRPVPLYYAIARHGQDGLRLLPVPLGFDEEALVAFLSWGAAQRYFLSEVFSGEWYARECSRGELISLLLGPYKSIEWVLLDPFRGSLTARSVQTTLMNRERFLDHLLG